MAKQIKGCRLTECKVDHNFDAEKAFGFGSRLDIRLGFAFFGRQARGFLATRSTSFEHKDLSEHWSSESHVV